MAELIIEKLKNLDKELHLIMEELASKEHKKSFPLSELNKLMEKDRVLDADSTKLIREMRDKEYDL